MLTMLSELAENLYVNICKLANGSNGGRSSVYEGAAAFLALAIYQHSFLI